MYYRKEVIFQMKKQSKVTSQSAMLQQNTRSTYRILIISIVMMILFVGSNLYLSRINSQQLEATMYMNQYRLGSKTLTAAVQPYAVTGDKTYYNNMKELHEDRDNQVIVIGAPLSSKNVEYCLVPSYHNERSCTIIISFSYCSAA